MTVGKKFDWDVSRLIASKLTKQKLSALFVFYLDRTTRLEKKVRKITKRLNAVEKAENLRP